MGRVASYCELEGANEAENVEGRKIYRRHHGTLAGVKESINYAAITLREESDNTYRYAER